MYRDAVLDCPACGARLAIMPATLPLWGCNACGGAWLGPDATLQVMRGLGDDVASELAQVSGRVSLVPTSAPASDSGSRRCPSCSLQMSRLSVAAVTVDSCPTHGTWFDRHEVTGVVVACNRLRRKQRGLDGTMSSAWNALVSIVEDVLGARRR